MAPKFSYLLLAFLFLSIQPFISQSRLIKSEGQAFSFLQNTEQVRKGQTVTGLHVVKKYLNKFGYYPSNGNLNPNDVFDDMLVSALKTYQHYYNLEITGKLNSDTMKSLMTPRCGLPDITNITYTKPIKGKNNVFISVSNYAFPIGLPRWSPSNYQLTYNFKSGIPEEEILSQQEIRSAFSKAFQSWEGASQFRFQQVPDGSPANIVIGFYRGDHGDNQPFDGPGMVLAHSYFPEDGRSHYDADENWSTNPASNQIDLQSVAVHEIGHLLGLAHSSVPQAIMYSGIPPGTIKRDLTQDDIDVIRALYPN